MTTQGGAKDGPIRVATVDDHAVVRRGIRALLEAEEGFVVVAEAASGAEAVDACARTRPDVVLMDLRLPGGMDGAAATAELLRRCPATRVVILTTFSGDEAIHRALDAGARGYLLKEALPDELVGAIRAAHAGRRPFSPAATAGLVEHGPRVTLTPRERDVLAAVSEGLRNKEVAARLGMTEATARTHVENILGKLGCRDRTAAVSVALARGLLDP